MSWSISSSSFPPPSGWNSDSLVQCGPAAFWPSSIGSQCSDLVIQSVLKFSNCTEFSQGSDCLLPKSFHISAQLPHCLPLINFEPSSVISSVCCLFQKLSLASLKAAKLSYTPVLFCSTVDIMLWTQKLSAGPICYWSIFSLSISPLGYELLIW